MGPAGCAICAGGVRYETGGEDLQPVGRMNYYNENDKFAANWLRELIKAKLIPEGEVDDRSITEIESQDLRGYAQCHFFAGIGGWPKALELSGWDANRPIWSGSCPCQSLSCAGKGLGEKDERHLWPVWFGLIEKLRPSAIIGEQVASKDGREWFSGVRLDLEALGYAVGAADLPAASVGSPHKRNRLFWVADSQQHGLERHTGNGNGRNKPGRFETDAAGSVAEGGGINGVADPKPQHNGTGQSGQRGRGESTNYSFWSNSIAIPCADGKWRRVPGRVANSDGWNSEAKGIQRGGEHRQQQKNYGIGEGWEIEPLLFPLADGFSNRVGALRGAGNAIIPAVAAEFIKAFMEIKK